MNTAQDKQQIIYVSIIQVKKGKFSAELTDTDL